MPANLMHVQWLSIAEIAELWTPSLKTSKEIVIHELRLGYFKYEKSATDPRFQSGVPLKYRPTEDELPSVHERGITKEFMRLFCKYQRWALPEFWFDQERRPRGRPARMPAIVQELHRRAASGELEETPSRQAYELHAWARATLPREEVPAKGTIYNQILGPFRGLKQDAEAHRSI
jgi:hypothetical protein